MQMRIVDDYLAELARRMQEILGDGLVAVYAGGSYALGAYEQGRSDIDVTAVVAHALDAATKDELVEALRHEALPCPARGLELVVYPLATARSGTGAPGFELNLNTGEGMDFRVDHEPGDIEDFWFAIDRSILREHGKPLLGPPPAELFSPIPRDTHRHAARRVDALAPRRRLDRRRPQHRPLAALPRHRPLDLEAGGAHAA